MVKRQKDEKIEDSSGGSVNPEELVVGLHAVEAIVKNDPARINRITSCDQRRDKRLLALLDLAKNQGVEVVLASRDELTAICGHTKHQSVVAYYRGLPELSESQLLTDLRARAEPWLILILDEVQDPHNLGACLRSADGAAVDAVVVPKDNSVGITQVVQKVAAGAAATVRVYRVSNLVRSIRALQAAGVWVFGAAGESDDSLYAMDFTGSVALALGAEGAGMRKLTKNACDHLYQIPMLGKVESLNVSVAAGVSLFEVRRQRQSLNN